MSGEHSDDTDREIDERHVDSSEDGEILERWEDGKHVAYVVIPAKTGKRRTVDGDLGDAYRALQGIDPGEEG